MYFYRKKNLQNEKQPNQLFYSQEINKKRYNEIEKQSSINSSEVLIYQKNKNKDKHFESTKNLKGNFAQNEIEQIDSNNNINKNNNLVLDNDWNESKINFDNISVVSKVNSNDNNNEQSNIIDNNILFKYENFDFNNDIKKDNNKEVNENEQLENKSSKNNNSDENLKSSFMSNSCDDLCLKEKQEKEEQKENNSEEINSLKREKKILEEKLKKEQNINKEKAYHMEILKKALNDNILNNSKGNKNAVNLGIVLEYSKSKLENEKLKKNIIMQQIICDDMKKELETLKKENDTIKEKNHSYEQKMNKLEEYELKLKEKFNSENQFKEELNKQKQISQNLRKEINDLNQRNEELKELNEKIKKESLINNEEKNISFYEKLLKEKNDQINELKLENININKNKEKINFDEDNNDMIKIINDSCKNIEDISKKIKIYFDKIEKNKSQNDLIVIKVLKDYINNINPDINGNIALIGKLKIVKEFTNLIKRNLEVLFNHFEIFQKNIFTFNRINLEENKNNIFTSSNGQKSNKDIKEEFKNRIIDNNNNILKNNNLFKKIDLYKYKNNINTNNYPENSKENNISDNNNDFASNKQNKSKENDLHKKRIVFKSNLSEARNRPLENKNINKNRIKNRQIDDLFSDIFKEKLKKKKNIINLKAKELSSLINTNNQSAIKASINSFITVPKRSNVNVSEDITRINNTTNIFPSNKKIANINERNDIILSLHNTSRQTTNDKNDKEEKTLYGINYKEKMNITYAKKSFPIILTNTSNNYKKNFSITNSYIKNKDNYTLENNKIMESSKKRRNSKNNKNNLSLEMLQRELCNNKNLNNSNKKMNGLAEEIMRPSFLKGNNSLSINNKHGKKIIKINSFKSLKPKK